MTRFFWTVVIESYFLYEVCGITYSGVSSTDFFFFNPIGKPYSASWKKYTDEREEFWIKFHRTFFFSDGGLNLAPVGFGFEKRFKATTIEKCYGQKSKVRMNVVLKKLFKNPHVNQLSTSQEKLLKTHRKQLIKHTTRFRNSHTNKKVLINLFSTYTKLKLHTYLYILNNCAIFDDEIVLNKVYIPYLRDCTIIALTRTRPVCSC